MLFVAYLLLLFASVTCQNDLGIIKQRVVASLLPNDDHEAEEIAKQATGYEESLSANGSWPDIDYKDETRGGWKTAEHLSRVKVMCIAFRSLKSPVCNNTRLAYAIHDALDFWLIHDFKNPNWWYNEIGVPLDIANSYLLFEAQLTVNEKLKGIMIMERATWWKGWTGANLVWMCNIQVQRGLLTSNETAVTQCLDRIYKEIFIGHQQQDGIQTDGSFHQHGPELLAGSYGNVFTSQILGYINYTLGTKYFMSDDTLSIFSHLVLDGQQWMIYGGVWDWSVIGRECSSPHGSGDAMSPAMLQEVPGSRHQEYVNFANRIINKFNPPLVGTVYYWDSDYMVHRQPGYMVSLHMHSNRTIPARCVNSQGIKSEHFADGVVNLYYTGQEYDNIFPVWDWQRLPGITCEQNIPLLPCNYDFPVNSSNFVGGVTDNEHGVAAMHLLSHSLSSLNSWFFFPDVYVAMGTNVTCTSGNPVFTSLANQILDGNVTVKVSGDSTPLTLNTGNHSFLLRGLTDEDDDDDESFFDAVEDNGPTKQQQQTLQADPLSSHQRSTSDSSLAAPLLAPEIEQQDGGKGPLEGVQLHTKQGDRTVKAGVSSGYLNALMPPIMVIPVTKHVLILWEYVQIN
jgi:chondroitin AC lyase